MVYLVVSYVDPDEIRRSQQRDTIQEAYRIDQRNSNLDPSEIEICRILLQPGQTAVTQPAEVFFPGYNNIDLRYRRRAQARPQSIVTMAQVNHDDSDCSRNFFNLSYLLQSVEPLYPYLRGTNEPGQVSWSDNIQAYDLLYFTGQQPLSLNSIEFEAVRNYLNSGGILLVDAPADANPLIESIHALGEQLEHPLTPLEEMRRDFPLRTQPFLFAALPIINHHPLRLFVDGGIVGLRD